jgi:hypothetical protein
MPFFWTSFTLRFKQFQFARPANSLRTSLYFQLTVNIVDMGFDRAGSNIQAGQRFPDWISPGPPAAAPQARVYSKARSVQPQEMRFFRRRQAAVAVQAGQNMLWKDPFQRQPAQRKPA